MISAILLAAGESRRMGQQNKLLLPIGGKPLICHVVDSLLASSATEIIIVVGHEAAEIRKAIGDRPMRTVMNPAYEQGMGTSIGAGVAQADPRAHGYMICLSDLPMLTGTEYTHIIHSFESEFKHTEPLITVPVFQMRRGNPVIFSSHFREAIMSTEGITGGREIVKAHTEFVDEVEMENDHVLQDIDTLEAYRRLLIRINS